VTGIAPPLDANTLLGFGLLTMLVATVAAIALSRRTMTAILLMSVYSAASTMWLLLMDAPDVAFTEAVVGAGVSTVVLLGAVLLTRGERVAKAGRWRVAAAAAVTLVLGGLLVYAAIDLPALGDPASPANAHVGRLYLEAAGRDTGADNVVTAVLASYRGFDTLGEASVIFAAGVGVALMLGFGTRATQDDPRRSRVRGLDALPESDHHVVLRVAAKLLIPVITLCAFYVLFHGETGAGGGFQAGVVAAVAIILHALVFGLADTMVAVRPGAARALAALGVLAYCGLGVASIVNGGMFLDHDFLLPPAFQTRLQTWLESAGISGGAHDWGQHLGMLAVESAVFITVAGTMVTVFYGFAGRLRDAVPEPGA